MPLILKIFEIKISIFLHGFNTVCYLKEYKHSLSTLGIYRMTLNCSWIFVWIRAGSVAHKNVWILLCLIGGFFSWGVFYFGPHPPPKKIKLIGCCLAKIKSLLEIVVYINPQCPRCGDPIHNNHLEKMEGGGSALHYAGACNCELTQKIKTLVYLQHLLCNHISTIF